MSSLALELDTALTALGAERARALEAAVRQQIAKVTKEDAEWKRVMELMKQNHPHAVECIGAFADTDLERPPQGEVPAAKTW